MASSMQPNAPEVCPRLGPLARRQVPDSDCVPADWVFGLSLDEVVCEDEELGIEMGKMMHACEMQGQGGCVDSDKAQYPDGLG